MAAFKLPKATDEEKAARSEAIQRATADAAASPLEVAKRAATLIGPAAEVIEKGNPNAASDGLSAAAVLHAAVVAAAANVEINAVALKDAEAAAALRQEAEGLRVAARNGLDAAATAFASRMA